MLLHFWRVAGGPKHDVVQIVRRNLTTAEGRVIVLGSLGLRHPEHRPDRFLVLVRHVAHIVDHSDNLVSRRVLDSAGAEVLTYRVLSVEEPLHKSLIDHGYRARRHSVPLRNE